MRHGVAVALSAVAGFVDALGYLALGGVFVSFMSGNSTVLGVGVAGGSGARTWLAAVLVLAFVGGVAAGTWLGPRCGARRVPAVALVLAAVLAAAALVQAGGWVRVAGVVMAFGMGLENTAFQKPGQPGTGLTYMTGTLVRIGQRIVERHWRLAWADLLLWAGMVVGAGGGAICYGWVGLGALWVAVGALLVLAVWVRRGVP